MAKEKTYTVYENKGQLRVTIPRVLADALGIKKGDQVRWIVDRGDLILRKV
jgi:bifunctional DNA-binding transcriptional regulator/antitoxin component of YhaV-PrlF toxin-antitoxin module